MARVSYMEKDKAHPVVKELYERNEEKGWPVINLFKVMGHCPYIGLNFQRLGNAILKGEELPPKIREIAILRVGNLTKSVYEFTKHTAIAKQVGVNQQQIDDIGQWRASSAYNDIERAVLAYTDEVTRDVRVKDETFAPLKQYFSEHAIVELTADIGYYNMVSRILVPLEVELES